MEDQTQNNNFSVSDSLNNIKNKTAKVKNYNDKTIRQKKYKTYRKQLKSEIFELDSELLLNENDDAVIECKIGKTENIFSPYDIAKNRSISESFHSYLMQEAEIIPPKHDIELKMYVDSEVTEEQETQIKHAIKRHYSFMITTANVILRKNALTSWLLYVCGIITLILNLLTDSIISNIPIKEALLISTWFFFWEATSRAFFDRHALSHDRYNMLRIYNAKIIFVKK